MKKGETDREKRKQLLTVDSLTSSIHSLAHSLILLIQCQTGALKQFALVTTFIEGLRAFCLSTNLPLSLFGTCCSQ
jgi:hypothetical protein